MNWDLQHGRLSERIAKVFSICGFETQDPGDYLGDVIKNDIVKVDATITYMLKELLKNTEDYGTECANLAIMEDEVGDFDVYVKVGKIRANTSKYHTDGIQ